MDFTEINLGINDIERRLDKVLKKILPNMPLSLIYKNLRNGLIKINGQKAKPEQKLQNNDVLKIASFLLQDNNQTSKKNLNDLYKKLPKIIFQNEDILVLHKEYDSLIQKSKKDDIALDDIVKSYYLYTKKDSSVSFMPGPLHRLDRNTSGLICFSFSLKGAKWFSKNLQSHLIQKKYLGIVLGNLKTSEVWKDKITKNFDKTKNFQTVHASLSNDDDYNCITIASPLKHGKFNNKEITLVEFDIKTGKTHQIRSQSSLHNYPLLNDTAYNSPSFALKRKYFLHAYELSIPKNNELFIPEILTCPLDQDMSIFINNFFIK